MLFLAASGGFSILTWAAIAGVVAAVATAVVALRKVGPEKDALYITNAQGAAVIMDNLVKTLREELQRERLEKDEMVRRLDECWAEKKRLRAANEALTRRSGSRYEDRA